VALHDELLALAKELVNRNPGAPVADDLRRAVSTAYYALFHLLVHEATSRLITVAALRPRVARSFDHNIMKRVCQDYAKLVPNAAGQLVQGGEIVPVEIQNIATRFLELQQARHEADYSTAAVITQAQAQTDVTHGEQSFSNWAAVQTDPAADVFLAELLCRGIPKR
jgi:uncharacterized protein (UPF0332 family)